MARKQAETDGFRQRIASLDKIVEAIVNEFIRFGDRLVDSPRVFQETSTSPLLDDLKQTTGKILDHARTAESLANEEGGGSASRSETLPSMAVSTISMASQSPSWSLPGEFVAPFSISKNNPLPGLDSSPIHTGHFSPGLGYGLLNKTSYVSAAGEILSHYFVAGPNSFAMRLYRDTIILSIRVLTGEISIPGFIPSLMRYRFRYEQSDNFVTGAADFLQQLSLQDSDNVEAMPDTENESGIILFGPSHPVMTSSLRTTMHQDLVHEVGSVGEWLDPYNTQLHLQNEWGFKLTATTARLSSTKYQHGEMRGDFEADQFQSSSRSWSNISQEASGSSVAVKNSCAVLPAQPLAESLIWKSVCFGEGPRFYKGNIDATAAEFLARMMQPQQDLEFSV